MYRVFWWRAIWSAPYQLSDMSSKEVPYMERVSLDISSVSTDVHCALIIPSRTKRKKKKRLKKVNLQGRFSRMNNFPFRESKKTDSLFSFKSSQDFYFILHACAYAPLDLKKQGSIFVVWPGSLFPFHFGFFVGTPPSVFNSWEAFRCFETE